MHGGTSPRAREAAEVRNAADRFIRDLPRDLPRFLEQERARREAEDEQARRRLMTALADRIAALP